MKCCNCGKEMASWTLEGRLGRQVTIDVCTDCQAFWFDRHESLQLAPGATLQLMKFIGDHSSTVKAAFGREMPCARCAERLTLAHDMVRNMRFVYWNCGSGHGRFIGFFDFLKEKNFIRELAPQEIQQLKLSVQSVNCSNCGAAIDLQKSSACEYCHSPISILDMKQQQEMLAQLQAAAEPREVDPLLPLKLAQAKTQVSALSEDDVNEGWGQGGSGDLVQAGLRLVAGWITGRL